MGTLALNNPPVIGASSTHKERVAYYEGQFSKVQASFGAKSHYTAHAFFQLQGAIMGKSIKGIAEYAKSQADDLHKETLMAVDEAQP